MNSIFSQDQKAPKQATPDTRDQIQKAASFFHKASNDGEPDWAGMLLNAKDSTEKFRIRAAREAYQEEKKFQAFQTAQEAQQAHIASVLQTPNRNKFFYDNLKVSDPKVYWSVDCQRQMKSDKATMGLGFHLKGNK